MISENSILLQLMKSKENFENFLAFIKQDYANGLKNSYGMSAEKSYRVGSAEIDELIPDGLSTKAHYFYEIIDGVSNDFLGVIWLAEESKYESTEMFLYYIYIFDDFRKKGFAKKSLEKISQLVKEKFNLDHIFLNHFHTNSEGQGLYNSLDCTMVKSTLKISYKESKR